MPKNFFITGDCHRDFSRFFNLKVKENMAIICLGDFCLNYYNDNSDYRLKKKLSQLDFPLYIVRGNHEMRPTHLNIITIYDEDVQGEVYIEEEFPNIKYLIDGNSYQISYIDEDTHEWCYLSTLVIGGAYSVDKAYRLARRNVLDDSNYDLCAKAGWFTDEQLTAAEMLTIKENVKDKKYDLILSHTCPISCEPEDLFLSGIDQSSVDKNMENFLEEIKDLVSPKYWFWGHYHADRIEDLQMEMFYYNIESLASIVYRWDNYAETGILFESMVSPRAKKLLNVLEEENVVEDKV